MEWKPGHKLAFRRAGTLGANKWLLWLEKLAVCNTTDWNSVHSASLDSCRTYYWRNSVCNGFLRWNSWQTAWAKQCQLRRYSWRNMIPTLKDKQNQPPDQWSLPFAIAQCPDSEETEKLLDEGRNLDDALVTEVNNIIAAIDPTHFSIQKLCFRGETDCIPPEDASIYYESRSCGVSSPPCLDQSSLEEVGIL